MRRDTKNTNDTIYLFFPQYLCLPLVFSVVPNWVLINTNFFPSSPLSHNLNNPDILIQELSNNLLNLHQTYPGCFNILSVEFFLTFNYFPNF